MNTPQLSLEGKPETDDTVPSYESAVRGMRVLTNLHLITTPQATEWFLNLSTKLDEGAMETKVRVVQAFVAQVLKVPAGCVSEIAEKMIQVDNFKQLGDNEDAFTASQKTDPLEHELRIGNKFVGKKLGTGSFGTTYRAYDMDPKKVVAIKVSNKPVNQEDAAEITHWKNAERVTQLVFPGLDTRTSLTRKSTNDKYSYVEMKYYDGKTLQELLERGELNGLTREESLGLFTLLTHFLAKYVHPKDVTHCDIKPGNIMMEKHGGAGLVDYDNARFPGLDDKLLKEKAPGTAAYMSPEQSISWSNADARSDIYSLGATMVHVVTGKKLFEKPGFGEVQYLMAHQRTRIDDQTRKLLEERMGKDGAEIVLRCLEKKPEARYQSTMELGEALWKTIYPQGVKGGQTFADAVKGNMDPSFKVLGELVTNAMRKTKEKHSDTVSDAHVVSVTDTVRRQSESVFSDEESALV